MSYLKNLEQDYVLGNLEVYREFDSSHFISNAKTAITNKVETVNMKMKFDYYENMISKAINSFSAIKVDKESVKSFFVNYNGSINLDNADMWIKNIDHAEIGSFKPQYITQYIKMVQILINNVIKGEASQSDINRFMSGSLVDKVQAQVINTTLTYGLTPKELIKEIDSSMIKVSNDYIKGSVVPFISDYGRIKQDTLNEANKVLSTIRESADSVKAMIKAVDKIKMSGDIDFERVKVLNQVSYNTIRGIIDIISYVSYLLIRKINNLCTKVISCNQLYIDMTNYLNSMVTENTFEQGIIPTNRNSLTEEMMQGNVDAYTTFANNIYDFHKNIPTSRVISDNPLVDMVDLDTGMEIDQEEYNKDIYNQIGKAYLSISSGLDILGTEGDDYLLLFDDIIRKSGFAVVLDERFQNEINDILDTSNYESSSNLSSINGADMNIQRKVLAEIKDYSNNMQTIANIVFETHKKLLLLADRFENNINGEYKDIETVNQLKVFLKTLNEQFVSMTEKVAQNFFTRLKDLGNILTTMEVNDGSDKSDVEPIDTSSELDISESVFESILQEYEEDTRLLFESLESNYFIEKSLELRGVKVIFEEESAHTNNPTDNAKKDEKNNTKVTIVDNDKDANSKASNTSSGAKIAGFIEDTINKLITNIKSSKVIVDGKAVPASDWLNNYGDKLLSRSYNNVAVNVLPYHNMREEDIIADINKVKGSVAGLSQANLEQIGSKGDLYTKLFTFTNITDKDDLPISDQFTKYYKVKDGDLNVVEISNGELKSVMTNTMVPFCKNYVGGYKDSIKNVLNGLAEATDKTISSYSGDSVKEKSKWLSESIKKYSGSILNANRDKYTDYLKIVTNLAPKIKPEQQQPVEGNK